MASLGGSVTVGLAVGVDYVRYQPLFSCSSLAKISFKPSHTVRTGRCATVGVVTESVDMEATLSVGVVAGNVPRDGGRLVLRSLLEGDGSSDLGVTPDDSNYSKILVSICSDYQSTWMTGIQLD